MDVLAMWNQLDRMSLLEVSRLNNVSRQQLVYLFDQMGLTGRQPADPSPSEIAEEAKKIRRRWSPAVRRSRWIAARRSSHVFHGG